MPNARLRSGEYVQGITEVRDAPTGVAMDAGSVQECYASGTAPPDGQPSPAVLCVFHPSAQWTTVAEGTRRFIDTTISLTPGASYFFKVDYTGSGSWAAQVRFGGVVSNIYLKNLYLSRPMKSIGAGAELDYYGTGVGYLLTTQKNQYRLGGTNSFRYYL